MNRIMRVFVHRWKISFSGFGMTAMSQIVQTLVPISSKMIPAQTEIHLPTIRFDVQAYQKGCNDGFEKGMKEGEKHGFELAAKKLEPLLDSLQQGLLQLKNLRQDTYQRIEKEVVELALAIARKVICREIEVDKEVVVCVAREALTQVKDPGNIKIKLNPSDLEFINQTKYQLSELIGDIDNVTLESEDSIQSGGCVIETNLGEIDARIEKQLQAVEESFRTALEKASTED